ncbi:MAG: PilZ domain-containing protein [Planctomycetota bacterium]|jgi:hypothetical protein
MRRRRSAVELAASARKRKAKKAERELQAHFAGRREAKRNNIAMGCSVLGADHVFRALAVDMSRSGALLSIRDERFEDAVCKTSLMEYSERIWHHFGDGLEIGLMGGAVRVAALVVRVTTRQDEETQEWLPLVAVRFRTELSPEHCAHVGID